MSTFFFFSSGIGFGICEVLIKHGASVCMMGRTESKLQKACAQLNKISNFEFSVNLLFFSDTMKGVYFM